MVLRYAAVLFIAVILFACREGQTEYNKQSFIKVEGQKFIDSEGREVLFSGINFVSKNPVEKYLPPQGIETFQQFRNWGFNCIRLGIIWDGLEPEPGKYNEDYLYEIDKRIQWAADNEIYVFLDMHQDLYGAKFSDGAPNWATLDEGKEHNRGAIWSDSYLISPAVQTAFDNFWKNKPASDGVGIQDHYANLWKYLAKRYANNATVIGYDIMNEPFMGTAANKIMPMMLKAYAEVFVQETGQAPPSAEELLAMWADEKSRLEALKLITAREKYAKVVDAIYDTNAAFERNELQLMYQKVANAIREEDQNHILFLNHSYFSNTGVSTAIEPTKLPDGKVDEQVAYAAHGYDLVVDTKEVENPGYERVEFIFDRIAESGQRMEVPVLVGEWGAFHGKTLKMTETAQHQVGLIERHKFSNTYWAFYSDIGAYPYFKNAIIRPYPQYISGVLADYHYNFKTGDFKCAWNETEQSNSPTIIYVPNLKILSQEDIIMTPSAEQIVFEYFDKSNAGRLVINPVGEDILREIHFCLHPKKDEEISIQ